MKTSTIDPGDALVQEITVVDADIKAAAIQQIDIFIRASRYRVDKMRARAQVGAKLEATRAGIAMAIRNRKDAQGKKMTEGALKERLERHSVITALRDRSDRAYEEEEFAKLLLEACRHRRDAVRIIADMQAYEGNREGAEVERMEQRRKLSNEARKLQSRRRS